MFAQDNLFPSLGLLDDWQQTNLRAAEKTGKEKRQYAMTKELMVSIVNCRKLNNASVLC